MLEKLKSFVFIWVGPRKKGTKEIPGVTLDNEGNITAYSIEEQCHSVFQNVRTILEESGSIDLVDVTVFLYEYERRLQNL